MACGVAGMEIRSDDSNVCMKMAFQTVVGRYIQGMNDLHGNCI